LCLRSARKPVSTSASTASPASTRTSTAASSPSCSGALRSASPDQDSAEAVAVRWVDPAEITALMGPAYAVRVTDAFGDTAVTRAHDGVQLLTA